MMFLRQRCLNLSCLTPPVRKGFWRSVWERFETSPKQYFSLASTEWRVFSLCLLLLLPSTALAQEQSEAKPEKSLTFRFDFPDKHEFLAERVHSVLQIGKDDRQERESKVMLKEKIERREHGYRIYSTIEEVNITPENPSAKLMERLQLGMETTTDIDHGGNLLLIRGMKDVIDRVSKRLDPRTQHIFKQVMNLDFMERKAKEEWRDRYLDLQGVSFKPGDTYLGTTTVSLPKSTITLPMKYKFTEVEKVGNATLVTVQFRYASLPDDLKKKDDLFSLGRNMKLPLPTARLISVRGEGERVYDLNTMMMHSEESSRVISMSIAKPDEKAQLHTRHEKTSYRILDKPEPTELTKVSAN